MVTQNNSFNTLELLDEYTDGSGKDPFSIRYELVSQLETQQVITPALEFFCRLDKIAFAVYGKPAWVEIVSVHNRRGAILLEETPGEQVSLPSMKSLYRLFENVAAEFGR
jgi:hypothetical protein